MSQVNKCNKCNLWPLEYIKRFKLNHKIVFLTKIVCTDCNKESGGYARKEKSIEKWNNIS